jgi:hypothetical protein
VSLVEREVATIAAKMTGREVAEKGVEEAGGVAEDVAETRVEMVEEDGDTVAAREVEAAAAPSLLVAAVVEPAEVVDGVEEEEEREDLLDKGAVVCCDSRIDAEVDAGGAGDDLAYGAEGCTGSDGVAACSDASASAVGDEVERDEGFERGGVVAALKVA